ncbi:hypothetical protein HUN08_17200 [Gordonia sp. X0973]|uniref:hypothetical protein n=1 Tax=Gordonia sp. X0973 TaxID=2742602 RepID=UPI000F52D935|nr:hypothetical protein [Gordonia sp. X0973]QKT08743.1 hypothetical protein HUN08_17200 [Gordonia sp. X0973]
MGRHNFDEAAARSSRPLITVAAAAILVAAAVFAWFGLHKDSGSSTATHESPTTGNTASGSCTAGDAHVDIVADARVATALGEIAKNYNATRPVVGDHCIQVGVRPIDSRAALAGLTADKWDTATSGSRPAAWIPGSSVWAGALAERKLSAISGQSGSLVTSPVLIAARTELIAPSGDGGHWFQAPYLTYANAFAAYGEHKITGSARLAMPMVPGSDATALAAQAYAYNFSVETKKDTRPLSAVRVAGAKIQTGLRQLVRNPPHFGDGSAEAAVHAIADAPNVQVAAVRTVPISEQQLYLETRDWKPGRVGILRPNGATPVLDYPVIQLSGVPSFTSDAVGQFIAYAKTPDQIVRLTDLGFRGPSALPRATATVNFPPIVNVMPTAQPGGAVAVSRVVLPAAV